MAITIINKPQLFTPVGSPVIWKVATDAATFMYFRLSLQDGDGNTISNIVIYPTPDYATGSYINLSAILSNVVKWDIDNEEFIYSASKAVFSYKLAITEVLQDGTDGDSLTTDVQNVWDGRLNRLSFGNYAQADYVVQDEVFGQ